MSIVKTDSQHYTDIANAIRNKNGSSTAYKPSEMAKAIGDIQTSSNPVIQPLSVTENGTYTAPEGVDGYSPVTVDVQGSVEPPALGFVPSAWNSNGYFTDGTFYGDEIPDYCCYSQSSRPYRFSNLVLPDRIKRIGHYAFYSCNSMYLQRLPNSLTKIGDYAFDGCSSITVSSFPDGLVSIGTSAFCGSRITVSRLPDSVETVGDRAFYNCNKISRFTINAGLKVIPNSFIISSALTSVIFLGIPDSISSSAFSYNNNLTTINVPWAEGEVANAPWGATNATINYNYTGA